MVKIWTILIAIAGLGGSFWGYKLSVRESGFVDQQNNNWRLQMGPPGQPIEGEIFVYKFVDGFSTCFLAAERSRSGMWMHSFSCK